MIEPIQRLKWSDAIALLAQKISPIAESCVLDLADISAQESFRYRLSQAVKSPLDVPGHRNSAVDGYAYRHADFAEAGELDLISMPIAAGSGLPPPLPPRTARRIFTGACVPPNADTILMQEEAILSDAKLRAKHLPKLGANLRDAGEDTQQGAEIAAAGDVITPFVLARLHASGVRTVQVQRPLRIQIFATGDEVIELGDLGTDERGPSQRQLGQVIDSNTPMLLALLAATGFAAKKAGHLPDTAEDVRETLAAAANGTAAADVIFTTGGVSEGDADHVVHTIKTLGDLFFWRINIKPGRPLAIGAIGQSIVIGLPGNPIAVAACLGLIAIPILRCLAGAPFRMPTPLQVVAGFDESFKGNRREFLRASLDSKFAPMANFDNDGENGITMPLKMQRCYRRLGDGSGLLTSLSETDGLLEIPEGIETVRAGDPLGFYSYSSLFSPWPYFRS